MLNPEKQGKYYSLSGTKATDQKWQKKRTNPRGAFPTETLAWSTALWPWGVYFQEFLHLRIISTESVNGEWELKYQMKNSIIVYCVLVLSSEEFRRLVLRSCRWLVLPSVFNQLLMWKHISGHQRHFNIQNLPHVTHRVLREGLLKEKLHYFFVQTLSESIWREN